ncbi:MAG: hypothetical protein JNL13_13470 [Chitinophagaceae bacterium]|nr:hypothetical protein [Chitinophagaceae bacterium]
MKRNTSLLFVLLLLAACLKQKNEWPDTLPAADPALPVNFTLQQLNALYPAEGAPLLLDSEQVAAVVIRANDASGNIFRQLILEDSTAGIALLLDEDKLDTRFPVGQKVYLRLKGLYLGNDHGTLQLGALPVADNAGLMQVTAVQPRAFASHIVTTNVVVPMSPLPVNMADLTEPRRELVNRLITIKEVELANPEQDRQYAERTAATNISIRDCQGAQIVLRTSNYARFQAYPTPYGKGSITAVYTVYDGVGQLAIRDTNDMQMAVVRCDGSTRQDPEFISIQALRKLYAGRDTLLGHLAIRGVVTSDAVNRNFGAGNIIVQDGASAVMIYFGNQAAGLPDLGDSVTVGLSGAVLTRYNGVLELKNSKAAQVSVVGKGKSVPPLTLTLAALHKRFAELESVLVKIADAKITNPGEYGGNKTLKDATGTILLYTSNSAAFASTPVPTITKTFQGIVTPYDTTKELKIRNPLLDVY